MANTKGMTREERKKAKRAARKKLKQEYRKLDRKKLEEFKKKSKGGIKGFLLGTNEESE